MTGRAYLHQDFPEGIPQFFVCELDVERFSPVFAAAAQRVFGSSRDPLDASASQLLREFEAGPRRVHGAGRRGAPGHHRDVCPAA